MTLAARVARSLTPLTLPFSPPFSNSKANQDRALVAHPMRCAPGQRQALFMVCDGHGSKGEFASEFVARSVVGQVEEQLTGAAYDAPGELLRRAFLDMTPDEA